MVRSFLILLGLYLTFGFSILLFTPYNSFPDEDSHFRYVQHLRLHHRLPPLGFSLKDISINEGFQPPLYYLVAAPLLTMGEQRSEIIKLRLFSLTLGAASIFLVWKCAHLVFPKNEYYAVLITSFTSLNPQFIFAHAGISNVSMTTFTASLTVFLLVRYAIKDSISDWDSIMLGVAFGLSMLSRTIAIYLLAPCIISICLGGKRRIKHIAIFGFTAFAVAGWWYIRNWIQYEDPFLWRLHQTTVGAGWVRNEPSDALYIVKSLAFLHASFWAYFGREEFHAGIIEYSIYLLIEALAFIGLLEIFFRRIPSSLNDQRFNKKSLLLFAVSAVLAVSEILLLQLKISSPQGRYLYMATAPISVLLGAGLIKIVPEKYRVATSLLISLFLFGMCSYLLAMYWLPHYS